MTPDPMQRAAQVWECGDYRAVAPYLALPAQLLVREAGDGHGRRAVDVGTGTGAVASELSTRGWAVSACDVSEVLLGHARQDADRRGLLVDWTRASTQALPYADGSLQLVVSSFGIIFAPDPIEAIAEAARCTAPGGRLLLTAWLPAGDLYEIGALIARHLAGPQDSSVSDWSSATRLASWAAGRYGEPKVGSYRLTWQFPSVAAAIKFFLSLSPLHVATLRSLDPRQRAQVQADLTALLRERADAEGTVRLDSPYVLADLTRI